MKKIAIATMVLVVLSVGCEDGETPDGVPADGSIDPGTVVMHRLNRVEYGNTVRHLLGTTQTPENEFPDDDVGYGFDNIAAVLSTSPLHVELYERAADSMLAEVLALPSDAPPIDARWEAEGEDVEASVGAAWGAVGWNLWANGELHVDVEVATAGTYTLTARVAAEQAGDEIARAELRLDGEAFGSFAVTADRNAPELIEAQVEVAEGEHRFAIAFTNDFYNPDSGADRNLYIDWIALAGPADWSPEPSDARTALVPCAPEDEAAEDACFADVFARFLPRAFRRPVPDAERAPYLAFLTAARDREEGFEEGLYEGLKAALLSPHFIYRVERDASPDDPTVHALTQYELASRLSYFLWSSMPDDALFVAAALGELDGEGLVQHARRMLADPKAEALVDNFAGQWLSIRALDNVAPDSWYFPDFDEDLRDAMAEEMRNFFRTFLHQDRALSELLSAESTFVDARLAAHYGIDGEFGEDFTEVSVAGRRGLLGMAGVLTATSFPTRTSPVKRGEWVLSHLLCSAPEPPPPGVEGLPDAVDQDLPLRDRLEQHRADPSCSSCHQVMDQIGFGLEHFDGIGAVREDDDGLPIDASGVLPGEVTFDGAEELAGVLAANPWLDVCLTRQLATYALGRGIFVEDRASIDAISAGFAQDGGTLEALVVQLVRSDLFRLRRGGSNSGRSL